MILGVDTGLLGGFIGLENDIVVFKERMPTFKQTSYNIKQLQSMLLSISKDVELCGVEEVRDIFGVKSSTNFMMGAGLYLVYTALTFSNIPFVTVVPKVWQNYCRTNEDMVFDGYTPKTHKPKIDPKATALKVAGRLFPNQSFRATKRSTTPSDGLVDAALIAYYVLKNY